MVDENCGCFCKCYGSFFKYQGDWGQTTIAAEGHQLSSNVEIKILYRDRLKVFFKTVKEAVEAGYTDFDLD